ncbi:hypothetical protein R3P38DRAFT_3196472 [Favolaschia claudopus]|uniref:BED-type domain-containing protein n=1 Tax=Favolaschia claudopus TaxID=2862362 RepID=A0AAW0B864_9AGAR
MAVKCTFCGEGVSGSRGLLNHYKKCQKKAERTQRSVSHALQTHHVELAAAATRALEEIASQAVNDPPVSELPRSPSPLPPRPSGRPGRRIRLPARYRDEPPEPPQPLPPPPPTIVTEPDPDPAPNSCAPPSPPTWIKTEPNSFGVYTVALCMGET